MTTCTEKLSCRLCGSKALAPALTLTPTPPANAFTKTVTDQECFPLEVRVCADCGHSQLGHVVSGLFDEYAYVSGTSASFRAHFERLAKAVSDRVGLKPKDLVVEIGCLPEGKVIDHLLRPREVSTLHIGDVVQGLTGAVRVTQTFERQYEGALIVLKLRGSQTPLRLTPNHPVPVVRISQKAQAQTERRAEVAGATLQWVRADAIQPGDMCVWPKARSTDLRTTLDLAIYLGTYPNVAVDESSIRTTQMYRGRRVAAHNQRPLPRYTTLNENLARLVGYYISEGSSNGTNRWGNPTGSNFAFHRDERTYIDDVRDLLQVCFQLPSSEKTGDGKCRLVLNNSGLLQTILAEWCGHGAAQKHLPDWASASLSVKKGLLCGLFRGDGSIVGGRTSPKVIKFDTVSVTLATQVKQLLNSMGIQSGIIVNAPNGYGKANGLPLQSVRVAGKRSLAALEAIIEDLPPVPATGVVNDKWPVWNDHTLVRVSSVGREMYSGKVYNIETEDNTYVVDSVVVHNSNDNTLLKCFPEARRIGIEPAKNLAEAYASPGIVTLNDYFTEALAMGIHEGHGPAKLILANNVMAHINDLGTVVDGVKNLLAHDGLFVFEVQYLGGLMETGAFDLCMPPDSQVVVRDGVRPIGDLKVGDTVLSHLGRYRKVTEVFRRPFKGDLVAIHAYGQNTPLLVTPEHPVYVRRKIGRKTWGLGEFLPAKDVNVGDRVLKPRITARNKKPWISIETKNSGRGKHTTVHKFRVDHDFVKVAGYYLAEGSYNTIGKKQGKDCASVQFAFGISEKEKHLARDCAASIIRMGGSANIVWTKYGWHVLTYGAVARLLDREFSHLAENKRLPEWVFGLGDNLVEWMLRAYAAGDGYEYRDNRYLRISTVSDALAQGFALLANQIGWAVSINKSRLPWVPRTIASNPKPTLTTLPPYDILIRMDPKKKNKVHFESGYQHGTVHAVTRVPYEGDVCNIEVEEDHTYVTPLTAVHNCYHEHLDYHALTPLLSFFADHGLTLVDVEKVPTHGGSLRCFVRHAGVQEVGQNVADLVGQEAERGLLTVRPWKALRQQIDLQRSELQRLFCGIQGRKVVGYGAPAKMATFCYEMGISADTLEYVCDDSPLKAGTFSPGLNIPILPPSALYEGETAFPDAVLILAWNFASNIIDAHKRLREENGTYFITPFPVLTVTS
jgi:hypothetical protein